MRRKWGRVDGVGWLGGGEVTKCVVAGVGRRGKEQGMAKKERLSVHILKGRKMCRGFVVVVV